MPKTYKTVQGDTWDIISFKQYGSELYTKQLVEANPTQRKTLIFGAGTLLTIPDITPAEQLQTNAPPWRRSS